MARRFMIFFFALGAVGGFWSALRHGHKGGHEAFERHVADLCADAALHARTKADEKR